MKKRKLTIVMLMLATALGFTAQASVLANSTWGGLPLKAAGVNSVPYSESFDTQSAFSNFMVVDANADGTTWFYNSDTKCARYNWSDQNDADDWLLTPYIYLEGGKHYFFSFTYERGYRSGEKLAVAFGQGDDPSAYEVVDEGFEIETWDITEYKKEVSVATSRNYRFGIHAISPKKLFYINIDDISVTAGSSVVAPDVVTGLSAVAGSKGALEATLTFRTPAVDGAGNTLQTLEKVEVMRNGILVKTFDAPAADAELSFTDTEVGQGMAQYAVVPYNEAGAGREALCSVYVGIDTPLPPVNVRLIDNGATVTAQWDSPGEVGLNGGYVNVDNLTYNVYDFVENLIGQDVNETSFLDDDAQLGGTMGVRQYYVTAKNDVGESQYGASTWLVKGDPVHLPLKDSFRNASLGDEIYWWYDVFGFPRHWSCTSAMSYDNDNGSIRFYGENPGDDAWLNTGKIDIRKEVNPYITMACYVYPGKNNHLEIVVSKSQKEEVVFQDIDFSTMTGEEGWRKILIPLASLQNENYIVLKFHAVVNDVDYPVVFDALEMKNIYDCDLSARLKVDAETQVGRQTPVVVTVENVGSASVDNYTVNLFVNDELYMSENGKALDAGSITDFTFNYVPTPAVADTVKVYAVVDCTSDKALDDNTTSAYSFCVAQNVNCPAVDDLSGSFADNKVYLSWSAPVQKETVVEDFEAYRPWSVACWGAWTLADMDKGMTYAINGIDFPHAGDPYAYIIFNPTNIGINPEVDTMVKPYSGDQFAACFATDLEYSTADNNDDWLISPVLNGKAQQVSFYAKSSFEEYKEEFEVLYSSTDNELSSFTQVLHVKEVPHDQWTQYTVDLPEGAAHFAIRCTSKDKFLFMVDDITYQPQPLSLTGFNVYRDGVKIGSTAVESTSYICDELNGETHEYSVSAVYEEGESPLSNAYSITTGIDQLTGPQVQVVAGKGVISIRNNSNQKVTVYQANGQQMFVGSGRNDEVVAAPAGLYVVKVGDMVKKVIVK